MNQKLYTAFAFVLEHEYRRKDVEIPLPADNTQVMFLLDVDAVLQARIHLCNYLLKEDITLSVLSRKANMNRQSVQRIMDLTNTPIFSKVSQLLEAVGLTVDVKVIPLKPCQDVQICSRTDG